jgi:hypothetical protein
VAGYIIYTEVSHGVVSLLGATTRNDMSWMSHLLCIFQRGRLDIESTEEFVQRGLMPDEAVSCIEFMPQDARFKLPTGLKQANLQ